MNDRQSARVAQLLRDPEFADIVERAGRRVPGTCPACGVADAKVLHVPELERRLGMCAKCGAVLHRVDGDVAHLHDERTLSAGEASAVAAIREVLEFPKFPTCPFCQMISRAGVVVLGAGDLMAQPSTCARCGGMVRNVDGELSPFVGPLTEAELVFQDEVRALAQARRLVEQQLASKRRQRRWSR